MHKKLFILLFVLLAGVVAEATAQQYSGRWSLYPNVGTTVSNVVDAGSKVYFLTGGKLFHYGNDETYDYTSAGVLSDFNATGIYYDHSTGRLLVAYSTGNIDIINPDGDVLNVSAIKEAQLSTSKGINHVTFSDGKAYVATTFGIVVIDTDNGRVLESGIYNFPVKRLAVVGPTLVAYFWEPKNSAVENYALYGAPLSGKISKFSAFNKLATAYLLEIEPINDSQFLGIASNGSMSLVYTVNSETMTASGSGFYSNNSKQLLRGGDGKIYIAGNEHIASITPEGKVESTLTLPATLQNRIWSIGKEGTEKAWSAGTDGIGRHALADGTVLVQPYKPVGISAPYPHRLTFDNLGRLWVSNVGGAIVFITGAGNTDGLVWQHVSMVDGDRIEDRTSEHFVTSWEMNQGRVKFDEDYSDPKSAEQYRTWYPFHVKMDSGEIPYTLSANSLVPDIDDPDKFWVASMYEGIYLNKKTGKPLADTRPHGDVLNLYSRINTPLKHNLLTSPTTLVDWSRANYCGIDREGNLWTAWRNSSITPIMIVPNEVRRSRPEAIKPSDWVIHPMTGSEQFKTDICMSLGRHSDMVFVTSASYMTGIYSINTRGTWADPSDDVTIYHNTILDQDNNTLTPLYYMAMAEDKNGHVWVGHTEGVYVIDRPSEASGDLTLHVRRPVVARNDGSGYGDYLLDGANVSGIGVDPVNRKWVTTFDAGVYLVSADGTQILNHFTTDNSGLPTNNVFSVACDPNSNRVFFGTEYGLVRYESDAAPAQPDFSDVYVYPNPVRPEYNGWITIAGLMDNSLVKIADMQGNVVSEGRSSGGTFIWDGCNSAGHRVPTGVYLVLASSTGESDKASAIVSKIMIMN